MYTFTLKCLVLRFNCRSKSITPNSSEFKDRAVLHAREQFQKLDLHKPICEQ